MFNEFYYLLPLWILIAGAITVLKLEIFFHEKAREFVPPLAIFIYILSIFAVFQIGVNQTIMLFNETVKIDLLSQFFIISTLFSGLLSVLFASQYLVEHKAVTGEFYALNLFVVAGMVNVMISNELLTFFIGLEIMSIGSYVLAGYFRNKDRGIESALKYYLPGVFSTGFLLMGIAIIYGIFGSTFFNVISTSLNLKPNYIYVYYLGILLFLVGLSFKIALVPFHGYAPDVYEGSSSPISILFSTGVKVASFYFLIRIMGDVFNLYGDWLSILPLLSILTMTIGNIMAMVQNNIKRMLAFSSVAHAGYVLIAVVVLRKANIQDIYFSVGFYLLAYTFMTAGSFGLLGWFSRKEETFSSLDDLSGIAKRFPVLSLIMALFMFSLAGFPPTAGFFGKYYVFRLAIYYDYTWLAILGILNSFLSAYYYLRVVIYMYMKPYKETQYPEMRYSTGLALLISSLGVLFLGLIPLSF